MELTLNGLYCYVGNRNGGNISGYAIDQNTGGVTPLSGSPFPAGAQPHRLSIDPTDSYVYSANGSDHTVSIYRIDQANGNPIETPGSPVGAGTDPWDVVVVP